MVKRLGVWSLLGMDRIASHPLYRCILLEREAIVALQGIHARFRLLLRTALVAVGGGVYLHDWFGMAAIELRSGDPKVCIIGVGNERRPSWQGRRNEELTMSTSMGVPVEEASETLIVWSSPLILPATLPATLLAALPLGVIIDPWRPRIEMGCVAFGALKAKGVSSSSSSSSLGVPSL